MAEAVAHIHTDGAARGNPGPAAWSFVIETPGRPPVEAAECMGEATNNVAEYTALIRALERAAELKLARVAVFSDSELMVKQINGEYAVKSPELRDLHAEARELMRPFTAATISHVRRAENKRADALCNAALDGRSGAAPRKEPKKKRTRIARREDVDAAVLECLRGAAASWGASAGRVPATELVWDQIWSVLEDARIVR